MGRSRCQTAFNHKTHRCKSVGFVYAAALTRREALKASTADRSNRIERPICTNARAFALLRLSTVRGQTLSSMATCGFFRRESPYGADVFMLVFMAFYEP